MYLHGEFKNIAGETVAVKIVTKGLLSPEKEIGVPDGDVFFADDPVDINTCVNDTFDVLLRNEASIRLQTHTFIPDLFCADPLDAAVSIFRDGECLFAGYIQPQAYSQGFNSVFDDLELSCIDTLSALQFSKYLGIGEAGVDYDAARTGAVQKTFGDILRDLLGKVTSGLSSVIPSSPTYYYDCSKSIDSTAAPSGILDRISISELLFLNDDEDSVWTCEEVLEEMLRYLNLHIVQDGFDFRIFSWESVKRQETGKGITWANITSSRPSVPVTAPFKKVGITSDNVSADDTTISIGEVYNQLSLTCDLKSSQNLVESPLDVSALYSPYPNRMLYMRELKATDKEPFYWLVHAFEPTNPVDAEVTEWYMQVMAHPSWKFYSTDSTVAGADLYTICCGSTIGQQLLPNILSHPRTIGAALLSLGSVKKDYDQEAMEDNSPISRLEMSNFLCVSVNGNGKDDSTAFPDEEILLKSAPIAEYASSSSGGVISPQNSWTTNYIVISGSLVLNPVIPLSSPFKDLYGGTSIGVPQMPSGWGGDGLRKVEINDKKWFYTREYYKSGEPTMPGVPTAVPDTSLNDGLYPYSGDAGELYEFKYSAIGDSTDRVSKISVLACMLVIGNKCLVETGTAGQPSDFAWQPYKKRGDCADDEEYFSQCFYIGFNPRIGDHLIGKEYGIQNNVDYSMGIDTEGMAIPVTKADNLSGEIRFAVLGPVNNVWDKDITHKSRKWWQFWKKKDSWSQGSVALLSHVSNIFIKGFEIKIYNGSNNGIADSGDNDLVYISDTDETYTNKKDDLTFKICSALTYEETLKLKVDDGVKLSTPLDCVTGSGIVTVYDSNTGESAKPEQFYVDAYYRECHKPRILMKQKLDDSPRIGYFSHYIHPALSDKEMFVQGISRNLMGAYSELTLKEIEYD